MAQSTRRAPDAPRPVADPALRAMALVGFLLVPWFLVGPGGPVSSWVLQSGIDVLTVVIAIRLFRLPGGNRPARRFWAAVALAMGSSAIGDTYQTTLVILGRGAEISPVQTGFVVAGMVAVVIATLCHPLGGAGRQRLRLWLDATTVLAAVAVFLWYFMVAGQLSDGRGSDWPAASATAATMLLVTFGLVKLIFSATAPFTRVAGIIGALGVTGTAVGTPVAAMLTGQSESGLMFVAQLLPCLLVPFSLRLQEVQTRRSCGPRDASGRPGFTKMPYVAVAATQILLVIALPAVDPDLRIWGVATGVVLITGLVLARQVAAFHDNERLLTELDESMHRLSDQKEWFSALVQHASDLTVVSADDGTVSYASPAAERLLGAAPAGLRMDGWVHPDDLPALRTLIDRLASAPGTNAAAEIRLRHAHGGYRWLHVIGTDLRGNPSVGGIVWNGRDVTDARVLQDELRHQANHDALTGLANRTLLGQRLRETRPDARIAALLLDLDGFKQVNDVHGHHAGDEVLITVARRVETLLGDAGVVARLGGDEFAVLLPDADLSTATALADRIGAAVAEPIPVTGTVVAVGTSIGVAAGTPAEAERMLRDADAAMYQSKQARKAAV